MAPAAAPGTVRSPPLPLRPMPTALRRPARALPLAALCGALCGALLGGATLPAAAQSDAAALRLRTLAAACAACHGTEGRALPGSVVPGLAGQPAATLASQLRAFQRGEQPATVMHQLAKGYSDAQIDQLAAYFAARQP